MSVKKINILLVMITFLPRSGFISKFGLDTDKKKIRYRTGSVGIKWYGSATRRKSYIRIAIEAVRSNRIRGTRSIFAAHCRTRRCKKNIKLGHAKPNLSYELELWLETLSMTEPGRASSSAGWEGTTAGQTKAITTINMKIFVPGLRICVSLCESGFDFSF